jgi:hypothetical protein
MDMRIHTVVASVQWNGIPHSIHRTSGGGSCVHQNASSQCLPSISHPVHSQKTSGSLPGTLAARNNHQCYKWRSSNNLQENVCIQFQGGFWIVDAARCSVSNLEALAARKDMEQSEELQMSTRTFLWSISSARTRGSGRLGNLGNFCFLIAKDFLRCRCLRGQQIFLMHRCEQSLLYQLTFELEAGSSHLHGAAWVAHGGGGSACSVFEWSIQTVHAWCWLYIWEEQSLLIQWAQHFFEN